MARCPFATWRPLPETTSEPRITATQIVDHSIVGSAEGAYRYFRDFSNLESHFIVTLDGDIWQLVDTARQADAQYHGNARAISIETEDRGNPDVQPWTDAQLTALKRLHNWIADTHQIPRRRCRTWTDPGLGYHSMWGAPSNWTPVTGKTCPGVARISQWKSVLLPAFIEDQEDDMPTADEIADAVADRLMPLFAGDGGNVKAMRAKQAEATWLRRTEGGEGVYMTNLVRWTYNTVRQIHAAITADLVDETQIAALAAQAMLPLLRDVVSDVAADLAVDADTFAARVVDMMAARLAATADE